MMPAIKRLSRTGFIVFSALSIWTSAPAQELSDLPEEHFPALKTLLGTSANRKLSRDLRESEARARQRAADAYGRTRAHAGAYGAYILEDRENESLDSRTRFTWELGAERTLFEFNDAIEARRSLGGYEARLIDWTERQAEAAWLQDVRALFVDRIVAEQILLNRSKSLQAAREDLSTLRALGEQGRIAELDILEAGLAVIELEENLKLAEKKSALLAASLVRYTGLSELPTIQADSLLRLMSSRFDSLADRGQDLPLVRAPAIERLEAEIERADALVRIASSESLPRVSSWARIFQDELQGPEFSGTVTRTNYEAIVGVRWNFWDSGRSRNLARAERLKSQRLEKARDRHYAEFQRDARDLEFVYESALSQVNVVKATATLRQRILAAQTEAASTDVSLLLEAITARVNSSDAENALLEAYSDAWKTRTAWLLFVYGDPFVER